MLLKGKLLQSQPFTLSKWKQTNYLVSSKDKKKEGKKKKKEIRKRREKERGNKVCTKWVGIVFVQFEVGN